MCEHPYVVYMCTVTLVGELDLKWPKVTSSPRVCWQLSLCWEVWLEMEGPESGSSVSQSFSLVWSCAEARGAWVGAQSGLGLMLGQLWETGQIPELFQSPSSTSSPRVSKYVCTLHKQSVGFLLPLLSVPGFQTSQRDLPSLCQTWALGCPLCASNHSLIRENLSAHVIPLFPLWTQVLTWDIYMYIYIYVNRINMRISSHNYGGWEVPRSVICKLETQESQCYNSVQVWRPENQGNQCCKL